MYYYEQAAKLNCKQACHKLYDAYKGEYCWRKPDPIKAYFYNEKTMKLDGGYDNYNDYDVYSVKLYKRAMKANKMYDEVHKYISTNVTNGVIPVTVGNTLVKLIRKF